jgi:HD superfamily phosphodiesterase
MAYRDKEKADELKEEIHSLEDNIRAFARDACQQISAREAGLRAEAALSLSKLHDVLVHYYEFYAGVNPPYEPETDQKEPS